MLFYGKEIDFTFIILIVILILAIYILFSSYQQQKQAIPIMIASHSTTTSTTLDIPVKTQLKNGAFAISIWAQINSFKPSSDSSNSLNLMRIVNKNETTPTPESSSPISLTRLS